MANKLTKYLDELSTLYSDANKEICEHVEAIKDIEEQQNRLKASGNLTPKGLQERFLMYRNQIDAHRNMINDLQDATRKEAASIRARCESVFAPVYSATAESLDIPTLELLKAGVLTDGEMDALAAKFSNNATMLRVIGKYAGERDNNKMRVLAATCDRLSKAKPHMELLDAMISTGEYMIGNAPLSGLNGAPGIAKRYDELIKPFYDSAEGVTCP